MRGDRVFGREDDLQAAGSGAEAVAATDADATTAEGSSEPEGRGAGGMAGEDTATGTAQAAASPPDGDRDRGPQPQPLADRVAGLIARNVVFCVALAAGAVLRLIVMLGFQPAVLVRLDSYIYLLDASHSRPDPDNPDGYPFFLWLLKPLHSLALVVGLQHLMGLAIAVVVYVVLRRYGVPGWGATLATLPTLLDPREMLIEHSIMSDTLAILLMVGALAVVLARRPAGARRPVSLSRSVTAGLLMGASTLVRATALPLILVLAAYLLITRAGWRKAAAALCAGALPLVGYAAWFHSSYGAFNLTNSNGLFLWARTTSFANCKIIKPPPDLRKLCPDQNPGFLGHKRPNPYSWSTLLKQETPQDYLWSRLDWPWQPWGHGYEPYQVAFTPAKNALAQRFALRAIMAQPLDYATVVGEGIALTFTSTDHDWQFPDRKLTTTTARSVAAGTNGYEISALRSYLGSVRGLRGDLGPHLGTRLYRPYSKYIRSYQSWVYLPGLLFALVLVAGLAGILVRRRGNAAAVLLWTSAVIVLVLPIAENQFNYRYALAAVPLACMVVALVARRRAAGQQPGGEPGPQPGAG